MINKILGFFLGLWFKFKYRKNKYVLFGKYEYHKTHGLPKDVKIVPVEAVTQKDLAELGRSVNYIRPSDSINIRTMQTIRNRKTGMVIVYPGRLKDIKEKFGDDYDIVESGNKEETKGEIDLNADGWFGEKIK